MRSKRSEKLIAISIIEDNAYLRDGWMSVLDGVADFLLLGSYESCEEAFSGSNIGQSDVVLMDIGLPGMSGTEGVDKLTEDYPDLAVIMITVHDDDHHVFDAICAGAVGYLLKHTTPLELIDAIRSAYNGGSPMTPNIARKVINSFQLQKRDPLTVLLYSALLYKTTHTGSV